VAFMLTARNALAVPTATQNYNNFDLSNLYAKLPGNVPGDFGFAGLDLADAAPPTGATAFPIARFTLGTSSGTWLNGVGSFTADLAVTRAAAPDGPFNSFRLGIIPVDSDGVTLRPADLNLDTDLPANSSDRVLIGSTIIRFGQLRLGNASGSSTLPLRLPVETQYWNDTFFVTNAADSCTKLTPANIGLSNPIGGISTSVTSVTSPLQTGRGVITLAPPTGGNTGSVDVAVNLGSAATADACSASTFSASAANSAYLRGRWCNPPVTYTKDPAARARFGIRRGSDETIYMQELFN
jgi:hypothetical protein